MTPADNDRWTDDMIRLLRERRPECAPEPTATEAAAYLGTQIAEFAAWIIIAVCIAGFWIGTP